MVKYVIVLMAGCASVAGAQTMVQQPLAFDSCVQNLQTSPAGATEPPTTLVDTEDTKQVQYPVSDGQVTITCSRGEEQVTIAHW